MSDHPTLPVAVGDQSLVTGGKILLPAQHRQLLRDGYPAEVIAPDGTQQIERFGPFANLA